MYKYACIVTKENRLNAIRKIISSKKISSQEELLSDLLSLGFELTQATLSRDLKHLKAGRIPSKTGYVYVVSEDFVASDNSAKRATLPYGFLSMAFSGNIAVFKTLPAYANTFADAIDKAELNEILGTVAGNDTVIAVLNQNVDENDLKKCLLDVFPQLKLTFEND